MKNTNKLSLILKANAASCFFFGGAFAVLPENIGSILNGGSDYNIWIMWIGLGLVLNSFLLLYTSFLKPAKKILVLTFAAGDFIWVLGTLLLIALKVGITTPLGTISMLAIGLMVLYFGVQQWVLSKDLIN